MLQKGIYQNAPPVIGEPFAGGLYAGRLFFGDPEHALIDAGREFDRWEGVAFPSRVTHGPNATQIANDENVSRHEVR